MPKLKTTEDAVSIGKQQFQYLYQGCFNDNAENSDLNGYSFVDDSQNLQLCISTCFYKGFAYAGLQSGNKCMCGYSFGKYGGVFTSQCDKPCGGIPTQICGGNLLTSVFSTTQPNPSDSLGRFFFFFLSSPIKQINNKNSKQQ